MEATKEVTLDGVPVTHGLRVWDYDLRPGMVDLTHTKPSDWEPSSMYPGRTTLWFRVIGPQQGPRGSLMNAERCWVKHPFTGERA
jgi:hypothetical protein